MYFFGWGHRTVVVGNTGSRDCHICREKDRVQAVVEYRYFHLFWIFGLIVTRKYHLTCKRCGAEFQARSSRLTRPVKAGNIRFIPFGPIFFIILGGALVLVGPGDFAD